MTTTPAARLRQLLSNGPFIAVECHSALTARIVERAGIPAALLPGYPAAATHFAIPDNGVLTTTEMIELSGRIAEAIEIPLIVDADQGGESVADVFRSIRRYERVGVAGVHIEDETTPKHSHGLRGGLLSIQDMQGRVAAAVEARRNNDFVVIARTDELWTADGAIGGGGGGGSLKETIRRSAAYAEAGADMLLPTLATPDQVRIIEREVNIPIAYYGPPTPGAQLALYTGYAIVAAAKAFQELVERIKQDDEYPPYQEWPEREALIDQGVYDAVVRRWADRSGRPLVPASRRPE